MASHKTAHRRRRVHSSKRRKNVKSRKVMRGGRIFNTLANCKARVNNAKNYYAKTKEIQDFIYGPGKGDVNALSPCDSPKFFNEFTSKTGI
jgi:hypothetical protein